jgi:hypothetical protein
MYVSVRERVSLLHIWDILGRNLGPETSHPDWMFCDSSQSLPENVQMIWDIQLKTAILGPTHHSTTWCYITYTFEQMALISQLPIILFILFKVI